VRKQSQRDIALRRNYGYLFLIGENRRLRFRLGDGPQLTAPADKSVLIFSKSIDSCENDESREDGALVVQK